MANSNQECQPLSPSECDEIFAPLVGKRSIALAVSGGIDSVALMLSIAAWRNRNSPSIEFVILTVDHQLRKESANEASLVKEWSTNLNFSHQTLVWEGPKPSNNIQQAAREFRYKSMFDFLSENCISTLLTAHHHDDQVETSLLRFLRGSGIRGLSAMRPFSQQKNIEIIRPLLNIGKSRLEATVTAHKHAYCSDPSNESTRFDRVRVRKWIEKAPEGLISSQKLTTTINNLQRAEDALKWATRRLESDCLMVDSRGFLEIRRSKLIGAPSEFALRFLSDLFTRLTNNNHPPRLQRLETIWNAIQDQSDSASKRLTFSGFYIEIEPEKIVIYREAGRNGLSELRLMPGACTVWDNRHQITLSSQTNSPLIIKCLKGCLSSLNNAPINLPKRMVHTLPGIFKGNQLIAAPSLDIWLDRQLMHQINHQTIIARYPPDHPGDYKMAVPAR